MSKKFALRDALWLTILLLVGVHVAEAQQPMKVHQIGYLDGGFPSINAARTEAFRQGLRDLGYVEGKNIVVHYRHAEGQLDRLPALLAELLRLKVEIIVAGGEAGQSLPPWRQPRRFPLSCPWLMILSARGSSPVLHGLEETSQDWQLSRRK